MSNDLSKNLKNSDNSIRRQCSGQKRRSNFLAVCGPKFVALSEDVVSLVVSNALARLCISCFVPKI